MKKIYLISQNVNNDYDTYDSAVVCAENEEEARVINPREYYRWHDNQWFFQHPNGTEKAEENDDTWCIPKKVKVMEIGIANDDIKIGAVICSSFNAG